MSKEIEDIVNFWYMMGGGLIVASIGTYITCYLEEKKIKKEAKKQIEGVLNQRAHSHMDIHFEDRCLSFEEGVLNTRNFKYELSLCLRYYFDFLNQENQRKARIYATKLGDFS